MKRFSKSHHTAMSELNEREITEMLAEITK